MGKMKSKPFSSPPQKKMFDNVIKRNKDSIQYTLKGVGPFWSPQKEC